VVPMMEIILSSQEKTKKNHKTHLEGEELAAERPFNEELAGYHKYVIFADK